MRSSPQPFKGYYCYGFDAALFLTDALRPTPHHPRTAGAVSPRLGHARVLTVHRTVIHYTRAASLPQGEAFYLVCRELSF